MLVKYLFNVRENERNAGLRNMINPATRQYRNPLNRAGKIGKIPHDSVPVVT